MKRIAPLLVGALVASAPAPALAGDESYLNRAIFRAQLLEVRPVMDDTALIHRLTEEYSVRTGQQMTPDQLRAAMVMDGATLNALRQGLDPRFFRFAAHRHQVVAQAPERPVTDVPPSGGRIGLNQN